MNEPNNLFLSFPSELVDAIPIIDGKHFFTEPTDPLDDHVLDEIDLFPLNRTQQYQAPIMDFQWPQGSEMYQEFDRNLTKIQERHAHSTRPLDELATQMFHDSQRDSTFDVLGFIHHIRSQLSLTAREIQKIRMENYEYALGERPVPATRVETPVVLHKAESDRPSVEFTTIATNNALNIPEIRSKIGHYLDRDDCFNCSLVCKDWNQTFMSILFSTIRVSSSSYPLAEALQRNGDHVRSFEWLDRHFSYSYYQEFVFPGLKSLSITIDYSKIVLTDLFTAMILECQQITSLALSIGVMHENSVFWKAVSDLPHLEEITILFFAPFQIPYTSPNLKRNLQGLWNACSQVKTLNLGHLTLVENDVGALEDQSFPHLRHLIISDCFTEAIFQVALIIRCPNLEKLEWNATSFFGTQIADDVQDICKHFEEGNVHNLKSLNFEDSNLEERSFAEILQSLNGIGLQEFNVSDTHFGDYACESLQPFFSTLRILDFTGCYTMRSYSAIEILVSCPKLEDAKFNEIHAQDLDPTQSWSCRKTLRSFAATFILDAQPDYQGAVKDKQELFESIFLSLQQLHELRHLGFRYYFDGYDQANIRLSKGFEKMMGLGKLGSITISCPVTSYRPAELYWLIDNWPKKLNLTVKSPRKPIKELARRAYERRGIKIKN
ncbi:hypothetical protein BGZ49_004128 [Haplosporangium sp. Z 27]|nr:hypothetical protein BGZ49_004128 [Haplosporangium sp. Z 27]